MSKKELRRKLKEQAEKEAEIGRALVAAQKQAASSQYKLQSRQRMEQLGNLTKQSPLRGQADKDRESVLALQRLLKQAQQETEKLQKLLREG